MKTITSFSKLITFVLVIMISILALLFIVFIIRLNGRYKKEMREINLLSVYKSSGEIRKYKSGYPDGIPTYHISYQSQSNADEVINYYKKRYNENGWSYYKEIDAGSTEGITLLYKKEKCFSSIRIYNFENIERQVSVSVNVSCE